MKTCPHNVNKFIQFRNEKGCSAFQLILVYSSNCYQQNVFLTVHFLNGKWRHSSIALGRRLDIKSCQIKSFTSSFSRKEVLVHHFVISSCADMSCESCQFASSYFSFAYSASTYFAYSYFKSAYFASTYFASFYFTYLVISHLLISHLLISHLLISHLLILHLLSCSSPIHHFSTIQRLDRPVGVGGLNYNHFKIK